MSAGPTAWCRSPERGRYRSGAEKSPLPEFPATLRAAAPRFAEVACAAESVQSPKSMGPFPARRTSAARPAWSEACQPAVARRARPGFAGAPPCRRTVARACGRDQKRDGVAAELRAWPLVTQATDVVANTSTPAPPHNELRFSCERTHESKRGVHVPAGTHGANAPRSPYGDPAFVSCMRL